MRTYGRVHTAFWTDTKVRALSERGRILAFYMLTSPHSNMVGAFLLPDAYISDDLGWTLLEVTKTIRELMENGFCKRFKDGRHIAICKFLLYNPVESSGSGKSIARQFNQLPRDSALYDTVQLLKQQLDRLPESFANDLETIPGTTSTATATSQEQATAITRDLATAEAVTPKAKQKTKRSIPDHFPLKQDLDWANYLWIQRGRVDLATGVQDEINKFRDHHTAKGTASADWSASWRTWATNAIKFNNGGHNGRLRKPTSHDNFIAAAYAIGSEKGD